MPTLHRQRAGLSFAAPASIDERAFAEVVEMIQASRGRALVAVNTELVDLYWRVGEYVSRKIESATWGEGVVEELARYIQRRQPGLRGFTRRNLFRMRQFYETYRDNEEVAPLVRQLPWSHNLIILGQSKRPEEREFYLRLAIRERWSKRELERQLKTAAFERAVLGSPKVSPVVTQTHPDAAGVFKDSYVVEFLDLPHGHSEGDLHRGLVSRLKDFLIELGRDFCFVGSEYPVQVGKRDFALDLLFFHRGLNCLCAIELKVGRFEPEHLGKLGFYLEALDRDVRKVHEGPSIGILLCASKDNEVVEYALSRSLSPTLIAEYQTQLPDKKLLQAKLHEIYSLTEAETSEHRMARRRARPTAPLTSRQANRPARKGRKNGTTP
jgi:predicted nuclease of restriction endonuclease-like (RecB) superfamily